MTTAGTFESIDGGKTFAKVSDLAGRRLGFGMAAPGGEYPAVFIVGRLAGTFGFYRSNDRGQSWTRINDDDHHFREIASITGDRAASAAFTSPRAIAA